MQRQSGVTLLELMIVVAIVAILAMVAYPSYTEHIARGRRAEAKTALLRAAQALERFYTVNNCYPSASANCGGATSSAAALAAIGIPAHSGDTAAKSYYTITVTTQAQEYLLTATPQGFSDARCGSLTLRQTGQKAVTGTGTVADCWGK